MNPGHIRVQRELIIARDLLIASWVFNALERWEYHRKKFGRRS